ncbi:DCL family protein [Rhizobium ruizarguesonis]
MFSKVGEASTFFSKILNKYQPGDVVSIEDAIDLGCLIARHSEADDKVGPGISYFVVDCAPEQYPGKCFWAVRKDGVKIDFAIKHCLLKHPADDAIPTTVNL